MILHEAAYIFNYEASAPALLSGVQVSPVPGEGGRVGSETLLISIRPENVHFPRPKILYLENTYSVAGGKVFPRVQVVAEARELDLKVHLDAARLSNAQASTGIAVREWRGEHADLVFGLLFQGPQRFCGILAIGDEAPSGREGASARRSVGLCAGWRHRHCLPLYLRAPRKAGLPRITNAPAGSLRT